MARRCLARHVKLPKAMALSQSNGTALTFCITPQRVLAVLILALYRRAAAWILRRWARRPRLVSLTFYGCLALMKLILSHLHLVLLCIRGIMVMLVPIMPIWCFRGRPIPKKTAFMSIPKAVFNMQPAPRSRRVTRVKIGPSSVLFRALLESQSDLIRLPNCAKPYAPIIRILPMLMKLRRRNGLHLVDGRNCQPSRLDRHLIIST